MSSALAVTPSPHRLANIAPRATIQDCVVPLALPRLTLATRAYNALAAGHMPVLALTAAQAAPGYLSILPERQVRPGEPPALLVQVGAADPLAAFALEAGYSLYAARALGVEPMTAQAAGLELSSPIQAFSRRTFRQGYTLMSAASPLGYRSGSLVNSVTDGATIALVPLDKQGKRLPLTARRVPVRVMSKADLPGLHSGMQLVVPVLRHS